MHPLPETALVFSKALRIVALGWLIAFVLSCGVFLLLDTVYVGSGDIVSFIEISLGSGLVAIASLLPGVRARKGGPKAEQAIKNGVPEKSEAKGDSRHDAFGYTLGSTEQVWAEFARFTFAWGVAMLIRLLGTVALFVFCRYQMAQPPEWLAVHLLVWYVYLTVIEVTTFALAIDRSRQ